MNIKIALNTRSIQQAKNRLQEIKKRFVDETIMREFLTECTEYLKKQMEIYLNSSGIGSNVISGITSSWNVDISGKKATMTNNHDKAVFVEFGVGIVGKGDPHPKSSEEGYKYNVDKPTKDEDGSWHFYSDEADLDIPKSAIDYGVNGKGENNRMSIYTRGTKGVWYAYNAMQDLRMNIKEIWEKVKERVIG